jgi:hypothetical protein
METVKLSIMGRGGIYTQKEGGRQSMYKTTKVAIL